MPRFDGKHSDLDSAATLNDCCRDLWNELGMKVPYEALAEIRRIRGLRGGKQGVGEMKRELKILLAVRDGVPWQHTPVLELDHIISRADWQGGNFNAVGNLRLVGMVSKTPPLKMQ